MSTKNVNTERAFIEVQVDPMQMGPRGKEDFAEKVPSEANREGQGGMGDFRQGTDSMTTMEELCLVCFHTARVSINRRTARGRVGRRQASIQRATPSG